MGAGHDLAEYRYGMHGLDGVDDGGECQRGFFRPDKSREWIEHERMCGRYMMDASRGVEMMACSRGTRGVHRWE